MLKSLQYIAASAIVVVLFWSTQLQLSKLGDISTDATFYTTQLAELTRLEKELLQFRVDAAGFEGNSPTTGRDQMILAFDLLWSRANTAHDRITVPRVEALAKHKATLGELAGDLREIEKTVLDMKAGDEASWRKIDMVLARTAGKVSAATNDAYEELYQRATISTSTQRNTIASFRNSSQLFMAVILIGLILLFWQIRKDEKLNNVLKQQESDIRKLATMDPLTEVFNRRHFDATMNEIDSQPHKNEFHIAIIDLDGFKHVNDTQGHSAGDFVLKTVAKRLTTKLPSNATLARLGGDEFVFLTNVQQSEVVTLAQTMIAEISRPLWYEGVQLSVGASIGLSSSSEGPKTSSQMLKEADLALYSAKANGRGHAMHFNEISRPQV